MSNFDFWSPAVSSLALIQYVNAVVGAQGDMQTSDGIINCTSELLRGVRDDFERLQDCLPHTHKRFAEQQIKRTAEELEKARRMVRIDTSRSTGKRRINDICWVLKRKADLQLCLTALHQCHITLLNTRLEMTIWESKMPLIADRFTLEPMAFSYPRLEGINYRQMGLDRDKQSYMNGKPHALPTLLSQRRLVATPSLSPDSSPLTSFQQHSGMEEMSLWLLHKRRDDIRLRK
ncbi:hypothetical protein AJ79_00337 [Helicocarpus griseus UAMH5409]|uniref:NACHT-NTPase and P-loop NTPases N-terminal domain-containing protein n=1 Tax=Helicocarpus griseus UAMH5409 TaxID=1447875 RepID=A0A2B7YCC8_9EURO|nr:hypothetical protein AJ79_00337 [Helicocarpus griseus UAMH5409]